MRKTKFSFIVTFWWVLGCLLLGIFLLAFAPRESRASDSENRMLSGFPDFSVSTVLSADFMSSFEGYLSDGFFGRQSVIDATNAALSLFDRRTQEDRYLLDQTESEVEQLEGSFDEDESFEEEDAPFSEEDAPAASRPKHRKGAPGFTVDTVDEPQTTSAPFDPEAKYTMWLEDKGGGTTKVYSYSNENMQTFAETLQMYRDALPDDGVVHFANVPFSTVANRWVRQRSKFSGWGSNVEEGLQALVGERIYIHNIPAILSPHMDADEDVYYVTDHHWSPLGAYYACAEMIRSMGWPVIPYNEYTYKESSTDRDKNGNMDHIEVLYPLLPTHSYVVTNLNELKELDLMGYTVRSYRAFMNNTQTPWRRIVTGFSSGRRALVICDSFGNAFTPYLLPYYDEVYMTDLRSGYYSKKEAGGNVAELMAYYQVDDVYIILSTANSINSKNGLVYLRKYFEE